jgi:hypothetical protein
MRDSIRRLPAVALCAWVAGCNGAPAVREAPPPLSDRVVDVPVILPGEGFPSEERRILADVVRLAARRLNAVAGPGDYRVAPKFVDADGDPGTVLPALGGPVVYVDPGLAAEAIAPERLGRTLSLYDAFVVLADTMRRMPDASPAELDGAIERHPGWTLSHGAQRYQRTPGAAWPGIVQPQGLGIP